MTKLLSAFLSFLLFCSIAEGLTFPKHFDIPPIVEIPSLDCAGLYFPASDRIEVRNLTNEAVVVHEIGHSVMWDVEFPVCDSYLTRYARTNIQEDKAESFMIFYHARRMFRRRAAKDECLMRKYKAVYRVFYPRKIRHLQSS